MLNVQISQNIFSGFLKITELYVIYMKKNNEIEYNLSINFICLSLRVQIQIQEIQIMMSVSFAKKPPKKREKNEY